MAMSWERSVSVSERLLSGTVRTVGKSGKSMIDNYNVPIPLKLPESLHEVVKLQVYKRLQLSNRSLREERIKSRPPQSMEFVRVCHECGPIDTQAGGHPLPLVPPVAGSSKYFVEELGLINMHLIRINPDHWPVFLVHLFHLPDILSFEDDIVVELIPERGYGQLRAWEVRDGAEVETADNQNNAI